MIGLGYKYFELTKGSTVLSCLNRKHIKHEKNFVYPINFIVCFQFTGTKHHKHPAVNEGSSTGSNLRLGLSINPGITLGRSGSTFVLGGELGLYKNLTSTLEGTFSSGLTEFFYNYKEIQNEILIPVKAGVRYNVSRKVYVGAQAGVAFSTTDGGAYFIYSPSVGWKVSKQLDIGVKYDHFSNEPTVLGLNVTYRIDL